MYQTAFQIILHAGNSKSKSIMALGKAREGRLEEANQLVEEAMEDLNVAHEVQTQMIQAEAAGQKQEMNLIMVHAQDHIGMAIVMNDVAKEMLHLYQALRSQESR